MNSVIQKTADFLKSHKFEPATTEDGTALFVRCTGQRLNWTTTVDTNNDETIVSLLSKIPVKVPLARRGDCAKLIARLNYGKRLGAFHLDFRDGEVIYCISGTLTPGIGTEDIIDTLLGSTFNVMDKMAPEILKLIFKSDNAAEAKPAKPSSAQDRGVRPPGINN